MPKQKDLKRLVRARKQKTGESYTIARSQLLKKKRSPVQTALRKADFATLAGMSDDAVEAKTGCAWKRWVSLLDAVEAATWPHRDIAAYISENYDVSDWWAQMVTVGYERIRGLRDVGQRRGGAYEINKSKTFPVPVGKLYKMFSTTRGRNRWLPDVKLTVRKATPEKSLRVLWEDGTPVEMYFTAKGDGKSQVALQHRKLGGKKDAARMREYWSDRLAALVELLSAAKRRS